MAQLYVALSQIAINFNGSASYVPFDIGLGPDEILELRMLHIHFHPAGAAALLFDWALLQKNLRARNGIAVGRPYVREDNDILSAGMFMFDPVTPLSYINDMIITFPEPIKVPRSPSMEFQCDANETVGAGVRLYYQIKKVDQVTKTKLFKQFYGRGQTEGD